MHMQQMSQNWSKQPSDIHTNFVLNDIMSDNVLHFPSTCPFLIFREISHWYPHYPLSSPASVYWTRPVISPTIGNIWPGHMLFPPQTTKLTITWSSEEMVWDSERERYLGWLTLLRPDFLECNLKLASKTKFHLVGTSYIIIKHLILSV